MGPALRAGERKLLTGSKPVLASYLKNFSCVCIIFLLYFRILARPYSSGVERVTCNHKVVSSNLTGGVAVMSERLRSLTWNQMGYARVGSNPAHSVYVILSERLRSQTANLVGIARASSNLADNDWWGISSNGRALALHARGRGIDALILQLWLLTAISIDSLVVKRGI